MKSIYIAYTMIVTTFVLFLSFSWYIQFDHTKDVISMAVKRSLMSTMADYVDASDFEAYDVYNTFESYFKELALQDYEYELTLSGFIKEPLFMRVHCSVSNDTKLKGLRIEVDEAMIEELIE
ncbi:MAG: hypothetical protein ACI4U3_03135 [Traorella sp.]